MPYASSAAEPLGATSRSSHDGSLAAPLGLFLLVAVTFLHEADGRVPQMPGAAAMFLLLFALVLFARHAFDARTSILAGVVFSTSVGAIVAARLASPDALLAIRGVSPSPWAAFLLALAPWVVFLPSVAVTLVRNAAARRGATRAVLFFLAMAVTHGLATGTRGGHLGLLLLPWSSLLLARFWSAALDTPDPNALRRSVGLPFAATVLAVPVVAWLARDRVHTTFGVPETLATQACVFLLFVSIGLVTFIIYRHTLLRFAGIAAASLLTMSFATFWVVPRLREARRERGSVEEALPQARTAPGDSLALATGQQERSDPRKEDR